MATNEVKLKLSVDGAKAVLSDFDRVRSGMSGVSDAATTAAGAMRALGAAFSVGAVVAWGKAMIDAADAMNDMSQRVGIAVKDLAKYELAASQSGTTMETLARGIKGLAGNLVEHGAALKKAGIDTSNADKAMQQLANVFASMPDGVEKTNLAVKLFGKAGMDMIPMLNLGAEGLQTAAEKTAAYATQMAAMAPLADAFNDNLSVMSLNSKTLSMTMFNEVLPSLVKVTDVMTQADDQGNSLASVFGKGLRTAFETVALIASDVIFVFQGVGREIGGIAAQVVAAATGNWSGFSAISDAMKADAKKAREELDRFQENLVSRAEKVQTAYNKRQGFGEQVKSGTSGSTLLAALGADKAGTEAAKAANALLKERIELAKWNTKAVDELFDAQEKVRLQTEDQIKTARTTLEQIEFETRLLEMNTEQRAQATLERDLEREGIVKGTLAYDAYIVKLREAMAIKTGKEAGIKAAEDMADAQKKAAEESAKYWEDALMRAFESGKGFFQSLWDAIKNTLKTQVLKVTVQGVMGTLGLGASGAAMASPLGMAGDAAGIAGFGSNIISGLGLAATGFGQAAAATFSNGLIAGFSTNMANVGALASGGSWMTALGAAAPYLAIGAAVIGLISGNKKIPSRGTGEAALTYDTGGNVISSNLGSPQGGGLTELASGVITSMSASYFATAKQLGITAAEATFGFGGNTGKDSKGANFALWSGANGVSYSGSNNNSQSYTPEQLQLEASRAVFTALQASELPNYLSGLFDNITASTATQAQIDGVLAYGNALAGLNRGLMAMPAHFQQLAALSYEATQGLIGVSGGLENLSTNLGTYYTNFYSAEEQRLQTIKNINAATAGSGLDAATATRESFRVLVESWGTAASLATEEGQKTYAALLSVSGAFAQITQAAAKAADAMGEVTMRYGTTSYASAQSAIARARASAAASMPSLSVGTNFVPTDGPAYLHAGEAVVPRQYNPAAGGSSRDTRLHQLVEKLTQEVEMLRAEVRSDVSHNAKTARLLERVMPDGDAIATREATA